MHIHHSSLSSICKQFVNRHSLFDDFIKECTKTETYALTTLFSNMTHDHHLGKVTIKESS